MYVQSKLRFKRAATEAEENEGMGNNLKAVDEFND